MNVRINEIAAFIPGYDLVITSSKYKKAWSHYHIDYMSEILQIYSSLKVLFGE